MRSAYIAIGLTAAVWSAVLALLSTPSSTPNQAADVYVPRNAREQFAVDLLAALGNDQPTVETIAFVVSWTIAEDGGTDALARNNPLNTTMCGYNMVGAINGDGACGVQTYATYQDGIDATVATLAQSNFSAITYALQTNDAAGALQALIASQWASSHYDGGRSWPHVELPAPTSAAVASNSIAIGPDPCGWNVRVALLANGGALQQVTIAPGETWSFNATMGNPATIDYRACGGTPGGNWCNLAARFAQVARAFNAELAFVDHGVDLGAGRDNRPAIWNIGGIAGFAEGRQDLLVTNRSTAPLHFGIQGDDTQVSVVAWEK